jgi:hypothetical protein
MVVEDDASVERLLKRDLRDLCVGEIFVHAFTSGRDLSLNGMAASLSSTDSKQFSQTTRKPRVHAVSSFQARKQTGLFRDR